MSGSLGGGPWMHSGTGGGCRPSESGRDSTSAHTSEVSEVDRLARVNCISQMRPDGRRPVECERDGVRRGRGVARARAGPSSLRTPNVQSSSTPFDGGWIAMTSPGRATRSSSVSAAVGPGTSSTWAATTAWRARAVRRPRPRRAARAPAGERRRRRSPGAKRPQAATVNVRSMQHGRAEADQRPTSATGTAKQHIQDRRERAVATPADDDAGDDRGEHQRR